MPLKTLLAPRRAWHLGFSVGAGTLVIEKLGGENLSPEEEEKEKETEEKEGEGGEEEKEEE